MTHCQNIHTKISTAVTILATKDHITALDFVISTKKRLREIRKRSDDLNYLLYDNNYSDGGFKSYLIFHLLF